MRAVQLINCVSIDLSFSILTRRGTGPNSFTWTIYRELYLHCTFVGRHQQDWHFLLVILHLICKSVGWTKFHQQIKSPINQSL